MSDEKRKLARDALLRAVTLGETLLPIAFTYALHRETILQALEERENVSRNT